MKKRFTNRTSETVSTLTPEEANEWFTPARYIKAVRDVMGSIDLDPASCMQANQTVQASRCYYTAKDDGLSQRWFGNVFLNPPFMNLAGERSQYQLWTRKLIGEYEIRNIEQAILLIPVHTERKWFAPLYRYSICFVDHQILFERPGRDPYHLYHGLCFVYLGQNIGDFVERFSEFGPVAPLFVQAQHRVKQLQLEVAP